MELSWQRAICMPPHCHYGLFSFFFFQLEAIRRGFWKDTKPVLIKPQRGHFKAPEHMRRRRGALYFLFPSLRHGLSFHVSFHSSGHWLKVKNRKDKNRSFDYSFLFCFPFPPGMSMALNSGNPSFSHSLIFVVKKIFLCDNIPCMVVVDIIIVHSK